MCDLTSNNCGCGSNNSCLWIILILLFCGNGFGGNDGCGCGCGNDNSCLWIILILLFCGNGFGGCGNGCGSTTGNWGGCGCAANRDNCGCC